MLKKILRSLFAAIGGIALLSIARLFSKHARVRDDGGMDADVYAFGKRNHTKAVCITNQTPVKIAFNTVKSLIKGR